jgi:NAD(P)-dependent dehydrogenase (short-subunit alcohol dehydrogenase family)
MARGMSVLIVGGGSGIGAAAARMFSVTGADVMVADRDVEAAKRVASGIGKRAAAVRLDIARPEEIETAVNQTAARFGKLDALVNTAAFVKQDSLADVELDAFRNSFKVNVEGALRVAPSCLTLLKSSPSGAIVHTASLAGVHGFPRGAGYGPSKAALITLTRQMGLEWASYGIRANAVIPGLIDTPMSRGSVSAAVRARRLAAIPMHRLGLPEEVASLIVFLASPAASYLTAETYVCDGGLSESLFLSSFDVDDSSSPESLPQRIPSEDWTSHSPIEGLAALVVGGGSGIGEATAITFASNGGLVMVADRDAEPPFV